MSRTARTLGPLLLLFAIAIIAWFVLHTMDESQTNDWFDPLLLGVIFTAYIVAGATMLLKTRSGPWSPLGAGLLATMLADALLYFYVLATSQQWTAFYDVTYTQLPNGFIVVGTDSVFTDIVRALLVAGGPFMIVGLIQEWNTPEGA